MAWLRMITVLLLGSWLYGHAERPEDDPDSGIVHEKGIVNKHFPGMEQWKTKFFHEVDDVQASIQGKLNEKAGDAIKTSREYIERAPVWKKGVHDMQSMVRDLGAAVQNEQVQEMRDVSDQMLKAKGHKPIITEGFFVPHPSSVHATGAATKSLLRSSESTLSDPTGTQSNPTGADTVSVDDAETAPVRDGEIVEQSLHTGVGSNPEVADAAGVENNDAQSFNTEAGTSEMRHSGAQADTVPVRGDDATVGSKAEETSTQEKLLMVR